MSNANLLISSVFETTIRYLGGLLSAYELSNYQYPTLLAKAKEIADTMSVAWVGVGSTAQVPDSEVDKSESQTNPIPYGHMTPDNIPIVGAVCLFTHGRASHLLTRLVSRTSRKLEL